MKLVWTRPAHADRKKIREYIAQHAPVASLALDELFSEKAGLLLDHPGLGRCSINGQRMAQRQGLKRATNWPPFLLLD